MGNLEKRTQLCISEILEHYAEIQNFDPCPLEAEEFGVEE
jgi:hypothetical protein